MSTDTSHTDIPMWCSLLFAWGGRHSVNYLRNVKSLSIDRQNQKQLQLSSKSCLVWWVFWENAWLWLFKATLPIRALCDKNTWLFFCVWVAFTPPWKVWFLIFFQCYIEYNVWAKSLPFSILTALTNLPAVQTHHNQPVIWTELLPI